MQCFGENGIIKKAQQTKELYNNGMIAEEEEMNKLLAEYENAMADDGNSTGGDTPVDPTPEGPTMPSTWDSSKVTAIDDGTGNPVPLPNGFYYVGGDINTGIVISDKQGDTLDSSGVDMGNQFVWIPVASEADLERTDFDTSTGQPTTGLSTSYTEPFASGYTTETAEYNTMRTQVLKYGGFYIGRYEAGVNNTTLRTTATDAQTVVTKKGVAPYNYVPWGTSMSDIGSSTNPSGAVYLAQSMYQSSTVVTSTLCYGCQWDAMCRYLGNANRTTPTKSGVGLTGTVSTDISKNIYDLAGNCLEWTMEAAYASMGNNRGLRGGYYSSADPVSNRFSFRAYGSNDYYSFRCILYVK